MGQMVVLGHRGRALSTGSVAGISRFILAFSLFTLLSHLPLGAWRHRFSKEAVTFFSLWLALGYPSPTHLNFLKPPHPMTQMGDTKGQEAAIQGLHPRSCHQVTHVSLGQQVSGET